jgi:hypothetical protein
MRLLFFFFVLYLNYIVYSFLPILFSQFKKQFVFTYIGGQHILIIRVTWQLSWNVVESGVKHHKPKPIKGDRNCLPFAGAWVHPRFLMLLIFFVFCAVLFLFCFLLVFVLCLVYPNVASFSVLPIRFSLTFIYND